MKPRHRLIILVCVIVVLLVGTAVIIGIASSRWSSGDYYEINIEVTTPGPSLVVD